MMGSDARVSGENCRGGRKPTASASPATPGKAGRAVAEVGGLRSSVEVWESQRERRETTCSKVWEEDEGRGDGPLAGYQRRAKFGRIPQRTASPCDDWNSESRMRENRPSGLMRGGKTTVIGSASQSVSSRLLYTEGAQTRRPPRHAARCPPSPNSALRVVTLRAKEPRPGTNHPPAPPTAGGHGGCLANRCARPWPAHQATGPVPCSLRIHPR